MKTNETQILDNRTREEQEELMLVLVESFRAICNKHSLTYAERFYYLGFMVGLLANEVHQEVARQKEQPKEKEL